MRVLNVSSDGRDATQAGLRELYPLWDVLLSIRHTLQKKRRNAITFGNGCNVKNAYECQLQLQ